MSSVLRSRVGLVAICLTLTSCADPYTEPASRAPSAQPTPTLAAPASPVQSSSDARPVEPAPALPTRAGSAAAPSPAALARAYARETISWDWRTLPDRLERLRDRAAGLLSAELTDAIRAAHADESLARDHPASQGVVVAVSVERAGGSRRLVVVTRERETASGVEPLGPSVHRVYLGEARRTADGWRMVRWRRAP